MLAEDMTRILCLFILFTMSWTVEIEIKFDAAMTSFPNFTIKVDDATLTVNAQGKTTVYPMIESLAVQFKGNNNYAKTYKAGGTDMEMLEIAISDNGAIKHTSIIGWTAMGDSKPNELVVLGRRLSQLFSRVSAIDKDHAQMFQILSQKYAN